MKSKKIKVHPLHWGDIDNRLRNFWEKNGKKGTPPPMPLILGGAYCSNDVQKNERWKDICLWANENSCEHLIGGLSEADFYCVDEMSDCSIGPGGGALYLDWNFEPRKQPTKDSIENNIALIQSKWESIVGKELASVTWPLQFTGLKSRRLLVFALAIVRPPWGDWDKLATDDSRRTFTQLRKAINDAISPFEIDHIDFTHEKK